MNVRDAIVKRRSVRKYKAQEIPDEVLQRLLNAMRLAPSGANHQPWKFIVVRDKSTKQQLAAACGTGTRPEGQIFLAEAPVVIVACGSEKEARARYRKDGRMYTATGAAAAEEVARGAEDYQSCMLMDICIAMDHLTLAAVEEGLGTCWVGGMDEKRIKKLLSVPEDVSVPIVMPLGYPVAWPDPERQRKPLEKIVCYDKWKD